MMVMIVMMMVVMMIVVIIMVVIMVVLVMMMDVMIMITCLILYYYMLGYITPQSIELLNSCLIGSKPSPVDGIVPTKLYSINREVDEENSARLQELPGASLLSSLLSS